MGYLIRVVMVLLGFMIATGSAWAENATTATALSLREGPGTNYYRLASMPAGARVDVKGCRDGWCGVVWNGYRGYASQRYLITGSAAVLEPEVWPIFPPYPYRAGHYPKADWYYDMPPYTAISPSFYRKRHFLLAQERNRYRYMPHIFRDSGAYGDGGGPIEEVDIQGVSAGIRSTYKDTYSD
jgi:Bacterial SH3 domain